MTKHVHLRPEDKTQIKLASRYLGTLHAIEQAHQFGDDDRVWDLLVDVDPEDVRLTAEHLDGLIRLYHRSPFAIDPVEPSRE